MSTRIQRLKKRVSALENLLGVHSFQLMRLCHRIAVQEERDCSGDGKGETAKKIDVVSWCTASQADE